MFEDNKENKRRAFNYQSSPGFSLPSSINKKHARSIYWGFVFIFSGFLGYLVYLSTGNPAGVNTSIKNFYTLNDVYRSKGILRFTEEKNQLKASIAESIKNPENNSVKRTAESIAVYLFPEILPDTHFEKEAAMTLWIPLFRAIEKQPGTAEARSLYEEAKTEIWNYETPDKNNPTLSEPARETLKIYRDLSAP